MASNPDPGASVSDLVEALDDESLYSGDPFPLYARLRADCEAQGHALGQREHNADRWIAATAIRLGVPLVSNDGIFRDAPGLELETLALP